MKSADNPTPSVPEHPNQNPNFWFSVAIVALVFTIIYFIVSFCWVFLSDGDATEMKDRAQAITPFGVAVGALVTFFTVIWRGLLTAQQAAEQKRQNDSKDEEVLAKLLMDGTSKIQDRTKGAEVLAGLAALRAVVTSKAARYAEPAMEILCAFVQDAFSEKNRLDYWFFAVSAVNAGASHGHKTVLRIKLDAEDKRDFKWPAINGCAYVHYEGGTIESLEYNKITSRRDVFFTDVDVVACRLSRTKQFDSCRFRGCSFDSIGPHSVLAHELDRCELTGTQISPGVSDSAECLERLRRGKNWFKPSNPPTDISGFDWSQVLEVRAIDLNKW